MICPRCKSEIPSGKDGAATRLQKTAKQKAAKPEGNRTPDPEDAVRADRPPAPCPQCGWSTMWNE
jgi:hypothetical protein